MEGRELTEQYLTVAYLSEHLSCAEVAAGAVVKLRLQPGMPHLYILFPVESVERCEVLR